MTTAGNPGTPDPTGNPLPKPQPTPAAEVPVAPVKPTILGASKTTVEGVLSFAITTLGVITAFQIPAAVMTPQASHVWLYVSTGATFLTALCNAWVRLVQGDATSK